MPKGQQSPQEIIMVLNSATQTLQGSSRRDTIDALQKAMNNCHKWLKERRIPYHQNAKGVWELAERGDAHAE